jgi:hypothetical protein
VSIFNFHYATPPDTVALNASRNKPLADDETGFKGTGDAFYRREAWEFLLAGGAIFSHLDYSFTIDAEDGTAPIRAPTPGGGGPTLRAQLAFLKRFVESFDFVSMKPDATVVVKGAPQTVTPRVLAERGKQYAIYLRDGGEATLTLDLPPGRYAGEWVDPVSGRSLGTVSLSVAEPSGPVSVPSPRFAEDVALRLKAN